MKHSHHVPGTGRSPSSTRHARAWSAKAARSRFREGLTGPTAGVAAGHTQANLISVPADWAYDMLLFCTRNPKPCPVLDVTDAGSWTTALAEGADLRTDLPRYRAWRDGELVDEPTDVRAHWRDDLVSFLIGCSFTFEWGADRAGVPIRHVEQGRNVPMYVTGRQCRPAGRLPRADGGVHAPGAARPPLGGDPRDQSAARRARQPGALRGPVGARHRRPGPAGLRRPGGRRAGRHPGVLGVRGDPAGGGHGLAAALRPSPTRRGRCSSPTHGTSSTAWPDAGMSRHRPETGDTGDMTSIDLNADLGEGFGRWRLTDDAGLLSVVTSANVACGFHAGDPVTMRRVCELAAERGVTIGAQVSYRDLAGFGRRAMDVPPAELAAEVAYQVGALEVFRTRGRHPRGVRQAARRAVQPGGAGRGAGRGGRPRCAPRGWRAARARACPARASWSWRAGPGCRPSRRRSPTARTPTRARSCRAGRRAPWSPIRTPSWSASVGLAVSGTVTARPGHVSRSGPRSLCVHGDTPGAVELARRVRQRLEASGVRVEAFA